MREITSEIDINASPDRVWDVLTNFKAYPEWNPFVRSITGKVEIGKRFKAFLQPPNQKGKTFRPRVIKFVPRREFRWFGSLLIPGLFDGEHIFQLKSNAPKKVIFIQREIFKGILVPIILNHMEEKTRDGFNQMNAALKKRCESYVHS